MFFRLILLFLALALLSLSAHADSYYPPLVAPPKAADKSSVINELYNPEANGKNTQAVLDNLKKRYESALVTYFFLRRCKETDPGDYHIIVSALAQEMASVDAPGRLLDDTVKAAQGSYREVYAKSSCKDAKPLAKPYADYIKKLAANVPKD